MDSVSSPSFIEPFGSLFLSSFFPDFPRVFTHFLVHLSFVFFSPFSYSACYWSCSHCSCAPSLLHCVFRPSLFLFFLLAADTFCAFTAPFHIFCYLCLHSDELSLFSPLSVLNYAFLSNMSFRILFSSFLPEVPFALYSGRFFPIPCVFYQTIFSALPSATPLWTEPFRSQFLLTLIVTLVYFPFLCFWSHL